MNQMEKITTGVSYTTSAVGTGYWFLQLLDRVSPSQWAAIGVLGSLLFGSADVPDEPVFQNQRGQA
nr:phage holin [Escherichia coli]